MSPHFFPLFLFQSRQSPRFPHSKEPVFLPVSDTLSQIFRFSPRPARPFALPASISFRGIPEKPAAADRRLLTDAADCGTNRRKELLMKPDPEELARDCQEDLYRMAFAICRNRQDAEDAVQTAFVRYLQSRREFANKEHARAFLFRTVINLSKTMVTSFWHRNTRAFPLRSRRTERSCLRSMPCRLAAASSSTCTTTRGTRWPRSQRSCTCPRVR